VIRKLDRYLFLSFFFPFLLCMALIMAMSMVVETSERLGKLLKYSGDEPVLLLLGQHYLYRIPTLGSMIAPVITLAGAVVSLVRLARHNELMAMEATGISLKRIALPLLSAGVVAAGLACWVQEVVVPGNARTMQAVEIKLFGSGGDEPQVFENVFAVDKATSMWLRADVLDLRTNIIRGAEAGYPGEGEGVSPWQINEGVWKDDRWYVTGVQLVAGEEQIERRPFQNLPLPARITPENLAHGALERSFRPLSELKELGDRFPSQKAIMTTEIHKRLSYPLVSIVLLLLTIPLVVGPGGQASVRGIGLAVLVSLGFYVVMLAMLDFGYRGFIPPAVAAWTPMAAFAAIGGWMFTRVRV